MLRRSDTNSILGMFLADLGLTVLALWIARELRFLLPFGQTPTGPLVPNFDFPLWLYLIVPVIWAVTFLALSVYGNRRVQRPIHEIESVFVAVTFATLILAGLIYISVRELSRLLFLYFYITDLVLLLGWRLVLRIASAARHRRWPNLSRRVLIVGTGPAAQRVLEMLSDRQWLGILPVGLVTDEGSPGDQQSPQLPVLGPLAEVSRVVTEHRVDDVIIALQREAQDRLVSLVSDLHRLPVRVYVVPDLFDLAFYRTTVEAYDGIPLIGLRDPVIEGFPRVVKRAFDLVVVILFLPILLPLLAVVAVAIKLDSPGPILYRQQRAGENGKLFSMLKFRSMHQDADRRLGEVLTQTEDGQVLFKSTDDPRVTRVGRWIRSLSVDEWPQIFNVLRGEMSLVGPRPEQPWLVDRYEPWQCKRFAVPQGMTGWWQVNGRSDKPMHLHTEEDLYYIQNYSLLLDLRILWRTVGAVIRRRGAR